MLSDLLNECTDSMATARSLRENKVSADNYKKTVDDLIKALSHLDDLVSAVKAINKSEFESIVFNSEQIQEIMKSISECGTACSTNALTSTHVSALSAVLDKYIQQVTIAWQADARKRSTGIESYLTALMSLLDEKEKAKTVLKKLSDGRKETPSGSIVSEYEQNLKLAHSIADGYKLTPEVKEFLDKVRSGNATFSDLTKDVTKWIKSAGMSEKIKISF